MKKFLLIITFLVSTLTFAHEKTGIEKRKMYDVIQKQLDEGQINVLTAQKMWKAYKECCR
jgi:hypothetical protein